MKRWIWSSSSICFGLLLSGIVLLINVRAQAPQQAQIAFSSDRDGNNEIYVMDVDGKNLYNITNNPAGDWKPNWFDPAFVCPVSSAVKLGVTWGWFKQASE